MTDEHIGIGALSSALETLESLNPERIFLVTGKKSYDSSDACHILAPFLTSRKHQRFLDFSVNPKLEDVLSGVEAYQQGSFDLILAVGGGSVMDMAKLINAFAHTPDIHQMLLDGNVILKTPGVPLAAVPTTAGSGSEATPFAVIYINGEKYSLSHAYLKPGIVAVDPQLSSHMPPYLTASSGFDALGQAVESFWARGATEESRGYAATAISLILPTLEKAVNNPTMTERLAMAKGAYLAGKAIGISKTTIAHALSYYITNHYKIPHGHAVALTLGKFFTANSGCCGGKILAPGGRTHLDKTFEDLSALFGQAGPAECSNFWLELMSACGLESDFAKVGINNADHLEKVVASVNTERMENNPVKFSRQELFKLLSKDYNERPFMNKQHA